MNQPDAQYERDWRDACEDIAALAGLKPFETLRFRYAPVGPAELDSLDPFFDALGAWDPVHRTLTVDDGRCTRAASHLQCSAEDLIRVTGVHFCAKAVVHLGEHPRTGNRYLGWNDPAKSFASETYPLKPNHRFYDPLVREQELFVQIFSAICLLEVCDTIGFKVLLHLSSGHCGLYSLSYSDPMESVYVSSDLRWDWGKEIVSEINAAKRDAKRIFGELTRGVPLDREKMFDDLEEEVDDHRSVAAF